MACCRLVEKFIAFSVGNGLCNGLKHLLHHSVTCTKSTQSHEASIVLPNSHLRLPRFGNRIVADSPRFRNKHGHTLLVLLVLIVFARTNQLRKPRRRLKQEQVAKRARKSPIVQRKSLVAAPLVEEEPECLFCGEVGVAGVSPETGGYEAAFEVFAGPVGGDFGVVLVVFFGILEI